MEQLENNIQELRLELNKETQEMNRIGQQISDINNQYSIKKKMYDYEGSNFMFKYAAFAWYVQCLQQ